MQGLLQANTKENRFWALIFLALTAILWSMGGLLIKSIGMNSLAIAGMRSAIAALLLLAVIRRPKLEFSWAKLGGAISYAGMVILFVTSTKLTTAANAILLQYSAPIYVAIFGAWIVKEKPTWLDWAAIAVIVGGMGLFFLDKLAAGHLLGNICAIISGVCFAAVALFLRKQKNADPLESVLWGNILTALIGTPFAIGSSPGLTGWGYLFILGIFQLGLSYILYAAAIKHVTALEATLIPVLEPILNPIWVFLFVGEKPGNWALIGGGVVLVAVTARCVIQAVREDRMGKAVATE